MIATDFHVHAYPPGMIPEPIHRARAVSRAIRLGRDRVAYVDGVVGHMQENIHDPDADLLRKDLEAAGFRRAALLGIDWGLVAGDITEMTPQEQLAWGREVLRRHDGFFSFFLGIDPRRPGAAAFVREALADGAVSGLKLYPPAGFSPADEICFPIYEAVVAAGAAIVFHTGRQTFPFDIAHGRIEPYGAVQRRYPTLRLVFGHAGWPFWGREAAEAAWEHPHTWIEVSGWDREIATDLPRVTRFLRHAWSELGPHRVLFGSDFNSGPRTAGSRAVDAWKQVFESAAAEAGVDVAEMELGVDELLRRD